MTIFNSWYSANVESKLPADVPESVRKIAKQQMAECWNAAVDAAIKKFLETPVAVMLHVAPEKVTTTEGYRREVSNMQKAFEDLKVTP